MGLGDKAAAFESDRAGHSRESRSRRTPCLVPLRSRSSPGWRRRWGNPTAPSPLYRNYSRYRMQAHSLQTCRSLPRCSGSIRCSIRFGTIRASKNSSLRPRRKNDKAQPTCSGKRSDARHNMKYWEIIADKLSKAGWSWGCVSAIDSNGRTIWIADAHRDDGKRFVVRAVASESFALQTPSR